MLPAQDGFTVCRRLRAQGVDTPILMVTARDTVGDRVHGLDTGADDYLVKPFVFDEVVARLRALTRRGRTRSLSAILTAGPLSLDLEAHQARVTGTPMPLTATEYRLLKYLMRAPAPSSRATNWPSTYWGGDYDPCSNLADVYVGYCARSSPVRLPPTRSARFAASGTCWIASRRDAQAALVPRPTDASLDSRLRAVARPCQYGGLHGRARVRAARPRRQSPHAGRPGIAS